MDRNDRIKQKYYDQNLPKLKKGSSLKHIGNFDPDPYVDVILDRMTDEMDDEDFDYEAEDFITNMMQNPKLEIIFGKSSVLSLAQKAIVVAHFEERVRLVQELDTDPYVDKLVELFDNNDFDQFKKYDSEGDFVYDFSDYFKDENFTREQLSLIESDFYDRQSSKAKTFKRKVIPRFIISALLVMIPPFFIPNFLQRKGLLNVDAGWFIKISVGILSFFLLFFLMKKLFAKYANHVLKSENIFLT